MAGALFLLLTATASAQEVTISGGTEMTWASRDRVLDEAALWTPGGLSAGNPVRVADTFILPQISIRLDIESSPVRATIEVGNQVLHSDSSADPRFQEDRLGEATALKFRLQQAWLELYGVVRLGEQDFFWDTIGLGNPLFLGPSGSESPWGELPDSTVPPFPPSGTNTVPQTRRDRINPVGVTARLEELTIFALLLSEGGPPSADEGLWGGAMSETIGPFRASAVLALMTGAASTRQVWTGGGAIALDLTPVTLAAEGYRQFGTAGVDLRASGYASRGIVRYADDFWAQGTMVWVSGDRRGDD